MTDDNDLHGRAGLDDGPELPAAGVSGFFRLQIPN